MSEVLGISNPKQINIIKWRVRLIEVKGSISFKKFQSWCYLFLGLQVK